jgi:hypothetical protein
VNSDGETNQQDVISLLDLLNQPQNAPLHKADIDRDNRVSSRDIIAQLELVAPGRSRQAARLTAAP